MRKSMLGDTISGRVLPGTRTVSCTYLTSKEEEEPVTFLSHVAQIGHRRTRREVTAIVHGQNPFLSR